MADMNLPASFSSLPIELKQLIVLHMDLSTIKSTRLTCKLLCSLSTPHLISPHFQSFAHRPDSNRLLKICRHSVLSPYIQSIEFNLGEINEYQARHNIYFLQFTRDPKTHAAAAEEAWFRYYYIKLLREEYAPLMCDPETLFETFHSLPNLSTLSVSMTRFPLPSEPALALLESIWKIPSTRLLSRELAKEQFTTILFALLPSVGGMKLRDLSHDRLPFEFFAQKKTLFESMTPIFRNLTNLRLVLDYNDPNDIHSRRAFANLAICLKAAENLQCLNLCFQSRPGRKIDITPLLENLLSDSHESKSTFPKLQSLHMEGLSSEFSPLEKFLTSLHLLSKHWNLEVMDVIGLINLPMEGYIY